MRDLPLLPPSLLLILLISSCAEPPFLREIVELRLPEPPPAWEGLPALEFALSYRRPGGGPGELRLPPGARLRIELERGRPQALLARATSRGRPLRPAGALYPSDLGPQASPWPLFDAGGPAILELGWRGGWLASLRRALEEAGLAPEDFALERLEEELAARLPDPWIVEPRDVAAFLAAGSFRADRLREPPQSPLILPGPGPWSPESPLAIRPRPAEGGYSAELGPGFHRFLGPEAELRLYLFEDGSSAFLVSP